MLHKTATSKLSLLFLAHLPLDWASDLVIVGDQGVRRQSCLVLLLFKIIYGSRSIFSVVLVLSGNCKDGIPGGLLVDSTQFILVLGLSVLDEHLWEHINLR